MPAHAHVDAVIFDVDGTLVDSVDLHTRAWQEAFAQFGKQLPFAAIRAQIGKGADQLLPVFFTEDDLARFGDELQEHRGRLFRRRYLPLVKAFPQVRALFERLRAGGRRIAVASSAKKEELDVYQRIARIEDLIDAEISADDVTRSKPFPDIFIAAMERLHGITPDRALVVGDTPWDAIAAGRAGLRTIGVLCGGFPAEDLLRAGCVALYADPADLLTSLSPLRPPAPPQPAP